LIRLVAANGRFAAPEQGIPRVCAAGGEEGAVPHIFSGAKSAGAMTPVKACTMAQRAPAGVRRARAIGQRERAPAMPEPSPYFETGLALSATAAGAGATQKFPKPTHLKSPVGTAHEEQLTERIP
jgi:hypothetical protein